jgi:hypothetical protein
MCSLGSHEGYIMRSSIHTFFFSFSFETKDVFLNEIMFLQNMDIDPSLKSHLKIFEQTNKTKKCVYYN